MQRKAIGTHATEVSLVVQSEVAIYMAYMNLGHNYTINILAKVSEMTPRVIKI